MSTADPFSSSTAVAQHSPGLSTNGSDEGPTHYWMAGAFADTLLAEFEAARKAGDLETLRARFYVLAAYYRRSLAIWHHALDHRRETLADAAVRNLIVLQGALTAMRAVAPNSAQSTLALDSAVHQRVNRDLVHRILRDAGGPLRLETIVRRFNQLDLIADARTVAIEEALKTLVQMGHASEHEKKYAAGRRPYIDTDVDWPGLVTLLGPTLARRFADAGFEGISHVLARQAEFRERFLAETGFRADLATVALALAAALMTPAEALHTGGAWHADLSSSAHPRPYQRLLHAVFRARDYAGQVIEAPAGSGKTLIGMLCIEDWLRTMAPGQSVLILVPTVNYQRQWVDELCLHQAGLQMSPNLVFAGTLAGIEKLRHRAGVPAVLVITYEALAKAASAAGKGGFDRAAIERFLQGSNVRHVILDEIHKVAADLTSSSADVVRVFREWLRDGSMSSLIGFSGTLAAFRPQLRSLGLELAYVLPAKELIAQGWVAPFAEFGAPFNYSQRERDVAALVDEYKTLLHRYLQRIGSEKLRAWFAAIPLAERVRTAKALGMYAGRRDVDLRIRYRMTCWESGGDLSLNEAPLASIVQVAHGWSDRALLEKRGAADEFDLWMESFERIRARIRAMLPPGRLLRLLTVPDLGDRMDAAAFGREEQERRQRVGSAKEALGTTFVGAYLALRSWPHQVGEGRVSAVRSIVAAEQKARAVSGVIVFDNPTPLQVNGGTATPGYRGALGLFAHILGDGSCVPMAALASGIYLPDNPTDPVHEEIADWIERRLVGQELRDALFALISAGAGPDGRQAVETLSLFDKVYGAYLSKLTEDRATRLADFDQQVLQPLRAAVRHSRLGPAGGSILNQLSLDHQHLRTSVRAIVSYAEIAAEFRTAPPVDVLRGDGRALTMRVVRLPGGQRRQLVLDLTSRIIDSDELPVNLIVVSNWARTGWNVVTPNVLIDATATRDATAWQQLRGRAMRPAPSWSSVAQRLEHHLLGGAEATEEPERHRNEQAFSLSHLPLEEVELAEQILAEGGRSTDDGRHFREELAVSVMLRRNKVTHVYELVRAYGIRPQVEYNRLSRQWERSAAIADKHSREYGVQPKDGTYAQGPSHAPLIVAADPRRDLPRAFQKQLEDELAFTDETVVRGWLRAAATSNVGS